MISTEGISRPREAKSVARRISTFLSLNFYKFFSLSLYDSIECKDVLSISSSLKILYI